MIDEVCGHVGGHRFEVVVLNETKVLMGGVSTHRGDALLWVAQFGHPAPQTFDIDVTDYAPRWEPEQSTSDHRHPDRHQKSSPAQTLPGRPRRKQAAFDGGELVSSWPCTGWLVGATVKGLSCAP